MILLFVSCYIAFALLIWFKTEAWLDYTKLLRLEFLSEYDDYNAKKRDDPLLTYMIYLRRYHNCFLVRLITCPVCVSVWLGVIAGLWTSLLLFPLFSLCGLLIYGIIDRLLG